MYKVLSPLYINFFSRKFSYLKEGLSNGVYFSTLFLIIYMQMQQNIFDSIKGESSVENIRMLEEKIAKVVDKIKALTEENKALNAKIRTYHEELKKKDDELKVVKQDMKEIVKLKSDVDRLNNERSTIKSQVEGLIKELESVEFITKDN